MPKIVGEMLRSLPRGRYTKASAQRLQKAIMRLLAVVAENRQMRYQRRRLENHERSGMDLAGQRKALGMIQHTG